MKLVLDTDRFQLVLIPPPPANVIFYYCNFSNHSSWPYDEEPGEPILFQTSHRNKKSVPEWGAIKNGAEVSDIPCFIEFGTTSSHYTDHIDYLMKQPRGVYVIGNNIYGNLDRMDSYVINLLCGEYGYKRSSK